MLNQEFGTNNYNDRTVTFTDVTILPDTVADTTSGSNAYTFDIKLNKNTLPNTSKEYILATVYHEILHAYMSTQISKDSSGKYLLSAQHETMATDYVALMIGALKIAFPSISDHDAWGLAWGGLEEIPFYNTKLNETQRTQVQEVNSAHKKSATTPRATFCN